MGYQVVRRTYQIQFPEDSDLHGLEIMARAMTYGELRDLQADSRKAAERLDSSFEDRELEEFIKRVDSWNMEDGGNSIPVSVAALRELEHQDTRAIVAAWYRRCLGNAVSEDLGKDLNGGKPSVEASIPMTES